MCSRRIDLSYIPKYAAMCGRCIDLYKHIDIYKYAYSKICALHINIYKI